MHSNAKLFADNDRVRTFQSKMLLSDAMQERAAQVQLNAYRRVVEVEREKLYDEMARERLQREEAAEALKKEQLAAKKREVARHIKQQHDEQVDLCVKRIQEERIEGELMKIKVQEALEEEEQKTRERKVAILENQRQVAQWNAHLKEEKAR